jgi:hypothetical protein
LTISHLDLLGPVFFPRVSPTTVTSIFGHELGVLVVN